MAANPRKVIVTEYSCSACGVDNKSVYHENVPELRAASHSAVGAAEKLAASLESSLDAVADPARREPVVEAIADIRAFVEQKGALR